MKKEKSDGEILTNALNNREIIHLEVFDRSALYDLVMNTGYVLVNLQEPYVTMIPVERAQREYYERIIKTLE